MKLSRHEIQKFNLSGLSFAAVIYPHGLIAGAGKTEEEAEQSLRDEMEKIGEDLPGFYAIEPIEIID